MCMCMCARGEYAARAAHLVLELCNQAVKVGGLLACLAGARLGLIGAPIRLVGDRAEHRLRLLALARHAQLGLSRRRFRRLAKAANLAAEAGKLGSLALDSRLHKGKARSSWGKRLRRASPRAHHVLITCSSHAHHMLS